MNKKISSDDIVEIMTALLAGLVVIPYQTYSLIRSVISEKLHPLQSGLERHIAKGNEKIVHGGDKTMLGLKYRMNTEILGELKNEGKMYKPAVLLYPSDNINPTFGKVVKYYDYAPEKDHWKIKRR